MLEDVGRQSVGFQDLSIQNIPRFRVFLKPAHQLDGKSLGSEKNVVETQEMPITCILNYSPINITCDPLAFFALSDCFYIG